MNKEELAKMLAFHLLTLVKAEGKEGGINGIIDRMTSGNYMHHKLNIKQKVNTLCYLIKMFEEKCDVDLYNYKDFDWDLLNNIKDD